MPSVNKAILMGHAGGEPVVKETQSGRKRTSFSLATTEHYKSDGKDASKTTWHRIVIWGPLGERMVERISKGSLVYVEGRIETLVRDDGAKGTSFTYIIADRVHVLREPGQKMEQKEQKPQKQGVQAAFEDMQDDIPF